METEPNTRHSAQLPPLRFSLNLLYVGRMLLGMSADKPLLADEAVEAIDEYIEAVTDELVATELVHEAALLVGDTLPDAPQP
ncbi:hypothetical protein F5984_09610 [Rudanella paleaurantiibacter]|uniref:Uncharacterized protein n=1 Tax=Rudanella paleaurantiibacter TaxID=2614655 RepID=A0A7J5U278_9BACT|nr:hypothetical protein [Rudanella paleaurantiibacter]KAB7731064.1 hypothetical protein F5984_09610 [Rudanella paleaurantiibacter]